MRVAWAFTERKMKKMRVGVLAVLALLVACTASPPPPEITAEGLVRVPSRPKGGVYRNLNTDFTRYKRLMIEPLTVEFVKGWRKQHPKVSDAEVRRIEAETAKIFLEVFKDILVDEGPFELAEVREADVLFVVPRVIDLNIPAAETEFDSGFSSYSPRLISMEITGELRDGVTGDVVLRVNMIESDDRRKVDQIGVSNRVTNAQEIRISLDQWARLVREAIDVAKASKPGR
jgi:hypothetical protein